MDIIGFSLHYQTNSGFDAIESLSMSKHHLHPIHQINYDFNRTSSNILKDCRSEKLDDTFLEKGFI